MSNIIKRTWHQNRMVNIEDLRGAAFQAEDGGHVFEIGGINDNGQVVILDGSVAGVFMRPDGTDVALTGSVNNGKATVELTDDCYAVCGRFGLTIFVTKNSKKTAVYACVGTVARSSYGVIASGSAADIVTLINAVNDATTALNTAIGSIPADYSEFMASVAPLYSSSAVYTAGSYAWYNGYLYKAVVNITTPESWTAAHWQLAILANDLRNITLTENGTFLIRHDAEWSGTEAYGYTTATGADIAAVMQSAILLTQIENPSGTGLCTLIEIGRNQTDSIVDFRSINPVYEGKYVRAHMDYDGPYAQITFDRPEDPTPTSAAVSNGRVTFSDAAGTAVFYFDLPLFDGSVIIE